MKKKKSCVRKNKCRLHVSVNSLLKANACKDGLEIFKNGHPVTKQNNDELIPLSECFKSNSIQDVIWALRATVEDSRSIAKEFAKRCASRAAAYAARAAAYVASYVASSAYVADADAEREKQKEDLLELLTS